MSLIDSKQIANFASGAKKLGGIAGGLQDIQNARSGGEKIMKIWDIISSLTKPSG